MAHYEPKTYDCVITGQGFTKSKNKGTPGFVVEFQPDGGDYTRKIDLWLTEKTVERIVEWLGSIGVTINKWSDLDPDTQNFTSLNGILTQFECKHERSQDGTKVYEKWELPFAGGNDYERADSATIRSIDRAFGAALKPLKKAAGTQPATQPQTRQERSQERTERLAEQVPGVDDIQDDGIPF